MTFKTTIGASSSKWLSPTPTKPSNRSKSLFSICWAPKPSEENRLITYLDKFAREGLGAQQILNKLFDRLDGFVGVSDHHLEDDASMVVLKVNEELPFPKLPEWTSWQLVILLLYLY